jgi:hypothetical protein
LSARPSCSIPRRAPSRHEQHDGGPRNPAVVMHPAACP